MGGWPPLKQKEEGKPTAPGGSPFYSLNSAPRVGSRAGGGSLWDTPSSLPSLHLPPMLFQGCRQRCGMEAPVPSLKWQRLAGRPEGEGESREPP